MRFFRSAVMAAVVTLALIALPTPGFAHHSFAMFDPARVVTLNGTVKEFRWVNPHVSLFVLADHPGAAPELWAVELTSPGNLTRLGWNRKSLNPGDKVVVEINPLRNGDKGGGFRKAIVVASGQVLQARLVDIEKNGEK